MVSSALVLVRDSEHAHPWVPDMAVCQDCSPDRLDAMKKSRERRPHKVELPAVGRECRVCLGPHDEEIHESTLRIHAYFRAKVALVIAEKEGKEPPKATVKLINPRPMKQPMNESKSA